MSPVSALHHLTGAYALDALSPAEVADFRAHLHSCEECRAEVESFAPALALLSSVVATPPPAGLRAGVLDAITRVRPLPPEVAKAAPAPARELRLPTSAGSALSGSAPSTSGDDAPPSPADVVALPAARAPLAGRLRGLLAAAAAVGVLIGGVAVWQQTRDSGAGQEQVLSAEDRVLQAPDAARERLTFPGGAAATLVRSVSQKQAVLITEAMPPAPEGKVYQVWLDVPGEGMVSAAVMPPKSDQTVLLSGDAAVATGAGITVEPAGGSAEPTSDPIALFDFSLLETAT